MSDDYGYINARIRAMKSFLLREEAYLEALKQKTQDEFISFLSSQASYANDFRQILTNPPAGFLCDEALKLNQCRIFKKIIRFSEGEPKTLILILLIPWDIYNLKTIIRGILGFQAQEEIIGALIPAGKWEMEFLKRLIKSKDLKTLADTLVTFSEDGFEKEFANLIRDYSQDTPLALLENALKELYFRKAYEYLSKKKGNAKIALNYISLQIDFLNILLVLKNVIYLAPEVKFIQGGRLQEGFLKDLIKLKSIEEVLKTFEYTPYPWLAKEGLDLYKRTQRLSSLERLLRNRLFLFCSDLYMRGEPLSISIPVAFINFKENEITNLRLISKAIQFRIPQELIKGELIYA